MALSYSALHLENIDIIRLSKIPYTLYNSTLRFQPDYGIYDANFEQSFTIMVDTGDESINAVEVGLKFDPRLVDVKELDTASSSCNYFIENTIDKSAGTAHLSCVMVGQTRGRGSLPIANVVVVPKAIGTFTLSFDPNITKVLAADGLGTNVLRMSQDSSYRIDNFNLNYENSTSAATSTSRTFVVFSPTHPNSSRWYNSPNADFVWRGKPNQVYVYAFDSNPDTVPNNTHSIQGNSLSIPVPGDGIFYFHLQLASGGPIAHYKIQSDRTPPVIHSVNLSSDTIVSGDVVRVTFNAEDVTSGVQQNYYVDLGNHLFLPTGDELFIPFIEPGDQTITLRVYDKANNYSEMNKTIHVQNASSNAQ